METPAQEQGRTLTLTATMPDDGGNSDAATGTRIAYTPDGTTPHGLTSRWEEDDKLMLCFAYNGNYYHADAPLEDGSIGANGKTARFTVTVPAEIPADAAFDFYAVYQKTNTWTATNGGYFQAGTANYVFEDSEEMGVTLDKTSFTNHGIIRPVLFFKREGATASALGTLGLNMQHTGWVIALHFKNSTAEEMVLPRYLSLEYRNEPESSFIWNGYHNGFTIVMDAATGVIKYSGATSSWVKDNVRFNISLQNTLPLHSQKLGSGESITLYRWVISTPQIEEMEGYMRKFEETSSDNDIQTPNFLPAREVSTGKVYHVYMDWDGTTLQFTNNAGTPL